MSTLKTGKVKTTTIADELDTESTAVTNVINGSAKAWVNFNGTGTVAIRRSFNVSSITDNSTGDYTVNFATAMADVNYCIISSNVHQPGTAVWDILYRTDSITTTSFRSQSMNTVNTASGDSTYLTLAVFS